MWRYIIFQIVLLATLIFPTATFANAKFLSNSVTPNFLVIYFHSYGGNFLEPFEFPTPTDSIANALLKDVPGVAIQSIDRDSLAALNGSDGFRPVTELITQRYAEHQSFKHIILCGTSLGAYEAIAYLHYAPKDILNKISGIISVEPTDDPAELYWKTSSPKVKQLLFDSFGGDPVREPDYYRTHSIKTLLARLPNNPELKALVVSAKRDQVVPPAQQKRLCATLRDKKFKVRFVEIDRIHSIADSSVYGNALHYVSSR